MRSASDVAFSLHTPTGVATYLNFTHAITGEIQGLTVKGGIVVERAARVASRGDVVDLRGQSVSPAFIDSHCHILPAGLDMQKLSLSSASSAEDVLELVRARHAELDGEQWLLAVQYDQTKFGGAKHLTRDQLDAISPTRPILLRHSNGHASVANSAALERAKVTESIADPKGGTFVRDSSGRLNGVLLERAHESVTAYAPAPDLDQMVDAVLTVSQKMAEFGIVEATDMMTGRFNLPLELAAYRIAAERGCPVRLRLCIQWAELFGPRAKDVSAEIAALDGERVAVWGAKIFADGAIGSATAAIHGTFTSDSGTSGTLIYSPDKLTQMVRRAHDAGYAVAIHTIGDRSTDHVMDAIAATDDPSRHRIEHAMLLCDAQIQRMASLGCHCTMQPEFLYRFGRSYRHHLGDERASQLNRYRSVKDAGIPLSFSSDRPIVSGDPWLGVFAATNRPEGFAPEESLSFAESMHAYSSMGSVANNGPRHELKEGDRAEFLAFVVGPD